MPFYLLIVRALDLCFVVSNTLQIICQFQSYNPASKIQKKKLNEKLEIKKKSVVLLLKCLCICSKNSNDNEMERVDEMS